MVSKLTVSSSSISFSLLISFFFFTDAATTEIYTLSLHDALPIFPLLPGVHLELAAAQARADRFRHPARVHHRSEEHTSELQSPVHLVCRLLLEKKKMLILSCATAMDESSLDVISFLFISPSNSRP